MIFNDLVRFDTFLIGLRFTICVFFQKISKLHHWGKNTEQYDKAQSTLDSIWEGLRKYADKNKVRPLSSLPTPTPKTKQNKKQNQNKQKKNNKKTPTVSPTQSLLSRAASDYSCR